MAAHSFLLFNYSIPADICSVLMRDHSDRLSAEEKGFCKDIILRVASSSFEPNYQYQISDGTQSTISVLPLLIKEFPEEKDNIKEIILLTLFDDYPIDMVGHQYNSFPIAACHGLWENHFEDAQSILFGYLL